MTQSLSNESKRTVVSRVRDKPGFSLGIVAWRVKLHNSLLLYYTKELKWIIHQRFRKCLNYICQNIVMMMKNKVAAQNVDFPPVLRLSAHFPQPKVNPLEQ